jgi:hypothetical protein
MRGVSIVHEEDACDWGFAARLNKAVATSGGALSDQSIGLLEEFRRDFGAWSPHVKIETLQLSLDTQRVLLQYASPSAVEARAKPLSQQRRCNDPNRD